MDNIQITLLDGSIRDVPRGTSAAQVAAQIGPRLAKDALVARADGELVDLSRPLDHSVKLSILTAKDPDAVQVFRHSAAHLLAAAVLELYPDVKARRRPADRHRIFLRIRARAAVHSRGPRKNRGQDARDRGPGRAQRAQVDSQAGSARVVSQIEAAIQMRAGRGKSRRADGVVLHHRKIHRLLPRPAHSLDRTHQGVQIDERRRRLLERRRKKSADAAHLRRCVSSSRRSSTSICTSSRKPSAAIIAASARSSIFSAFRTKPVPA